MNRLFTSAPRARSATPRMRAAPSGPKYAQSEERGPTRTMGAAGSEISQPQRHHELHTTAPPTTLILESMEEDIPKAPRKAEEHKFEPRGVGYQEPLSPPKAPPLRPKTRPGSAPPNLRGSKLRSQAAAGEPAAAAAAAAAPSTPRAHQPRVESPNRMKGATPSPRSRVRSPSGSPMRWLMKKMGTTGNNADTDLLAGNEGSGGGGGGGRVSSSPSSSSSSAAAAGRTNRFRRSGSPVGGVKKAVTGGVLRAGTSGIRGRAPSVEVSEAETAHLDAKCSPSSSALRPGPSSVLSPRGPITRPNKKIPSTPPPSSVRSAHDDDDNAAATTASSPESDASGRGSPDWKGADGYDGSGGGGSGRGGDGRNYGEGSGGVSGGGASSESTPPRKARSTSRTQRFIASAVSAAGKRVVVARPKGVSPRSKPSSSSATANNSNSPATPSGGAAARAAVGPGARGVSGGVSGVSLSSPRPSTLRGASSSPAPSIHRNNNSSSSGGSSSSSGGGSSSSSGGGGSSSSSSSSSSSGGGGASVGGGGPRTPGANTGAEPPPSTATPTPHLRSSSAKPVLSRPAKSTLVKPPPSVRRAATPPPSTRLTTKTTTASRPQQQKQQQQQQQPSASDGGSSRSGSGCGGGGGDSMGSEGPQRNPSTSNTNGHSSGHTPTTNSLNFSDVTQFAATDDGASGEDASTFKPRGVSHTRPDPILVPPQIQPHLQQQQQKQSQYPKAPPWPSSSPSGVSSRPNPRPTAVVRRPMVQPMVPVDSSNKDNNTMVSGISQPPSPHKNSEERVMSPRALAEMPIPNQQRSSSSPPPQAEGSPPAAVFNFDGTFRGWSYSSRPEIRLADLTAVDFLGEGHFGQVKCVSWEPKSSSDNDHSGSGGGGGGSVPGLLAQRSASRSASRQRRRGLFALKILERARFENKVVASGRTEEYYIFNEKEIMISLNSPFHIALVNTYKSAKNLYILMEYAEGRNLKDQIDRAKGLYDPVLELDNIMATAIATAAAAAGGGGGGSGSMDSNSGGSSGNGGGNGSPQQGSNRSASRSKMMSRVKFYAANLVLALEHLHSKGIMHRDIKPSNLLIDSQGYLKVCDYGFARWLGVGGKTRSIAGTYNYLTPEQALDLDYDHTVDLWCLGITVYNMVYGLTPFEAPEGTQDWQRVTLDNIQNKKLRFLDNRKQLPMPGKIFVKSLLMRHPEERFGKDLDYGLIRGHAWFHDIDFGALERRQATAPWLPEPDVC